MRQGSPKEKQMVTRTITIEDNLEDIINSAIDEVKELIDAKVIKLWEDDPEDNWDFCWNILNYDGSVSEIVDHSIPVYTKEIDDLWHLYKDEFIQAYEDAGLGEGSPMDNNGMTGIYFYIEQKVVEWLNDEGYQYLQGNETEQGLTTKLLEAITEDNKENINTAATILEGYLRTQENFDRAASIKELRQ